MKLRIRGKGLRFENEIMEYKKRKGLKMKLKSLNIKIKIDCKNETEILLSYIMTKLRKIRRPIFLNLDLIIENSCPEGHC